jgi:hypothetical protein
MKKETRTVEVFSVETCIATLEAMMGSLRDELAAGGDAAVAGTTLGLLDSVVHHLGRLQEMEEVKH